MATWKVIYWLIPLVVFVILAVFYPSLLEQLKSALGGTAEWVDKQVNFGAQEITADEIPVPKQLAEAYESLAGALERGNTLPRDKCLLTYKDFPEFEGFIITIDFIQEKMVLNLKTDKGVVLTSYRKEIPNLKPCLVGDISGGPTTTSNFYNNWVKPRAYPRYNEFQTPEYNTFVGGGTIPRKDVLFASGREYSLDDEDAAYFNERVNLLYKAADHAVCFVPTSDSLIDLNDCTRYDVAPGIDDDCPKEFLSDDPSKEIPVCEFP